MTSCLNQGDRDISSMDVNESSFDKIIIEAEDYNLSSNQFEKVEIDSTFRYVHPKSDGWIAFDINVLKSGIYGIKIHLSPVLKSLTTCWIEDYYDNKNDRTYNITGNFLINDFSPNFKTVSKIGTPLKAGLHKMKFHFDKEIKVDWIEFTLLEEYQQSPVVMKQNIEGSEWKLVWSDEFDKNYIDSTKWTFDFGNWGWGNNEIQYYTKSQPDNARVTNGNLIIEARKDEISNEWTSARLTTRDKVSFLYGKIECRVKVPTHKGNHSSVWTMGNAYVDEYSWPSCGEIDILETVGYEIDDITGNGLSHATAHGGGSYFKDGDKQNGLIEVANMNNEFHIYAVEWLPDGIKEYVDNQLYATYNSNSTDLSWPYSNSQNIILNLAMGGSWGGSQGIDEDISSQKMIIDYIRVYELN